VAVVNDFHRPVTVFHDIRLLRGYEPDPDDGYFHACFRRTVPETPGAKHEILPAVRGRGRYLGTHMGIITDPRNPLEWHRSNVTFLLDGDKCPSMLGASLDDYAGSAWLYQQCFMHQDSGLLVSRDFPDGGGHYGFYFYHRRDPLYFNTACEVFIRPGVPACAGELLPLLQKDPELARRISIPHDLSALEKAVESGEELCFYCGRLDELSTVAFYYLDRPGGDHQLSSADIRRAPALGWPVSDSNSP